MTDPAHIGPMPDLLPPLGGLAPPLQCNRLVGESYCGKPATWHIIWTADIENGLSCEEHAEEARARWVYFGLHPYDPVCSMPGALYFPKIDRCLLDDGEVQRAIGTEVTADA